MHLLVAGCFLLGLCSPAWASFPSLSYDTVTAGTIGAAAQTNTYTFSANANDILDFTVVTTSGNLLPCIEVSTYPAGTPVTNGGSCPGSGTIELNGLAIPSAGTYTHDAQGLPRHEYRQLQYFHAADGRPGWSGSPSIGPGADGQHRVRDTVKRVHFQRQRQRRLQLHRGRDERQSLPCMEIYNSAGAPVTADSSLSRLRNSWVERVHGPVGRHL